MLTILLVTGLHSSLKRVRQQLRSDSTSTALVVKNDQYLLQIAKDNFEWLQTQDVNLKHVKGPQRGWGRRDIDAFKLGVEDGKAQCEHTTHTKEKSDDDENGLGSILHAVGHLWAREDEVRVDRGC